MPDGNHGPFAKLRQARKGVVKLVTVGISQDKKHVFLNSGELVAERRFAKFFNIPLHASILPASGYISIRLSLILVYTPRNSFSIFSSIESINGFRDRSASRIPP